MSDFIKIGNERIRRKNIKSFGVSEGVREYEERKGLLDSIFSTPQSRAKNTKKVQKKYTYLFVTTYQNDNYRFAEDEIDIPAVLADLDKS